MCIMIYSDNKYIASDPADGVTPRDPEFREPEGFAQRHSGKTRIQCLLSLGSEPMFIPCIALSLAIAKVYANNVDESSMRFIRFRCSGCHGKEPHKLALDHEVPGSTVGAQGKE